MKTDSYKDPKAKAARALMKATKSMMEHDDFVGAARVVFDACKHLIRARAGYVALLNSDETENEVLFLDSDGADCSVDPGLPMPIRGLRERAYRTSRGVYQNDFCESEFAALMPAGHATLDCALFAPICIDSKPVGLMGLANKPGGFTDEDVITAEAFSNVAAMALRNALTLERLRESEAQLEGLLAGAQITAELERERSRAYLDATAALMVGVTPKGTVKFANRALCDLLGIEEKELVGMPLLQAAIPREAWDAARASRGPGLDEPSQAWWFSEIPVLDHKGEERLVSWQISALRDGDGDVTAIIGSGEDITDKVAAEESLRLSEERYREHLSELAAELLRTSERERRRIAVDLHEGVGQTLAAAKMSAQLFATDYDGTQPPESLERLRDLLDKSIDGIRLATAQLSPTILYELGLGPALLWLGESYRERFRLECEFHIPRQVSGMKNEAASLLFRITRELLDNVRRHSGVLAAHVAVQAVDGGVTLRVCDEGCGFDTSVASGSQVTWRHFGLFSITEEVLRANGVMTIESGFGTGTTVEVWVPIVDAESGADSGD